MSAEAFAVGIDFGSTNYRTAYRFGGDLVTVPDPPGTAALRTFLLASDDPRPRLRLVGLKSYLGDDERVASREGRLTSQQAVAYELRQVRELAATYAGGAVEYKYTRGSWDTVEKAEDGSELPNRGVLADRPRLVRDRIAAWRP